jgi:phosphate transport system protein
VRLSRILDIGLKHLTELVFEMFRLSISAVDTAVSGLLEYRSVQEKVYDAAKNLRGLYEEVSDIATELIARYQPVARDLRYIRSCMTVSYDLFRVGRYALEISRSSRMLGSLLECDLSPVREAGNIVREMLKITMEAFRDLDVGRAREATTMDERIDEIYREKLKSIMLERNGSKECDVAVALALRNLERIADHATYICEAVEYIVAGHPRHKAAS